LDNLSAEALAPRQGDDRFGRGEDGPDRRVRAHRNITPQKLGSGGPLISVRQSTVVLRRKGQTSGTKAAKICGALGKPSLSNALLHRWENKGPQNSQNRNDDQ
jgi:hypothetical protein